MDNARPSDAADPLAALVNNEPRMDRLAREAVLDALRQHKLRGESIIVWRDGKAVTLDPSEIPSEAESHSPSC